MLYLFSITTVNFHSHNNEQFLVVGTAKDANLAPRTCSSGYLYVYQFSEDGNKLNLLHKVKHLNCNKFIIIICI
jgi:splicing factor 3B subunit 3